MEIYNSLYTNTKNITTPLNELQKKTIIQLIPKLDQKGHELLFLFIRIYHNQQEKDISLSTLENKNDVQFDLDSFSNHLQHIINMFVRMHYEYISYELSREKL